LALFPSCCRFTSNKVGYCVKFNPDDDKQHLFVVGTADKKIVTWDIRLVSVFAKPHLNFMKFYFSFQVQRNRSRIWAASWSSKHNYLCRRKPTICIYVRRQITESLGMGHPCWHESKLFFTFIIFFDTEEWFNILEKKYRKVKINSILVYCWTFDALDASRDKVSKWKMACCSGQ